MNGRILTPLFLTLSSISAAAQGTPTTPATPVAPTTQATPATAVAAATPATPATQATPGHAHICLAPTSVETAAGSATDAMTAVRGTFTSYLTGPTLEVAPLSSRLESQARQEAKGANCPFLLLTSLKQVRKSGGGGGSLFGRVASGAVQQGAYTAGNASGSIAGHIAGDAAAGAAGAAAASTYSGSMQNNDELTLTSRLEGADGKVLVNMTDKRKAQSNGEDLLTPLVEKAATAVATAVAKPGQ